MLPGGTSPRPNGGEAVTLLELMRRTGLTAEEFSKLAEAKGNSDRLTVTEFEAMKLVESTGADAEPNRQKARTMLFDAKYHEAKAAIMRPIDEFMMLVDNRTTNAVRTARNRAMVLRSSLIILALALLLGAIREITARNRAERVLRESEERYRVLFENAAEGIGVVEPAIGRFHYFNPALCAMFGYTAEEFRNLRVPDLHPPGVLETVRADIEAVSRGEAGVTHVASCRRKDGTLFQAEIHGSTAELEGKPFVFGFFSDVILADEPAEHPRNGSGPRRRWRKTTSTSARSSKTSRTSSRSSTSREPSFSRVRRSSGSWGVRRANARGKAGSSSFIQRTWTTSRPQSAAPWKIRGFPPPRCIAFVMPMAPGGHWRQSASS